MARNKGKIELTIPEDMGYFRVVVWSKGKDAPDLSTNWIDIIPGKTYTLETDHLVPVVLMSGMGC
jgi:anti-sigma regulatory factor (Ser/Thr protein kinase)